MRLRYGLILFPVLLLWAGSGALAQQPVRENGTLPEDWEFDIPEGVTTRDVTYYSDDIACYARLFFPKDFDTAGKTPAVVLGHGFGGMHHGIDKFAAYFAERGLVGMSIDYRSWGWSDGYVSLLDPEIDKATDDQRITEIDNARIGITRTRLLSMYQVEDYRAAISYIQGEPGVDPDNIGVWGSSHSGGHIVVVPALDARVKAAVGQVPAVGGNGASPGPARFRGGTLDEAIKQARTNESGQRLAGFSWRRMHGLVPFNSGYRPFHYLERVPETTAILFIVAENEELFSNDRAAHAAVKVLKGPSEVFTVPNITHFQMYSGDAYKISSKAAADWFLKYLK